MLDPAIVAILVALVTQLLKALAAYLNFPIDEALLNTIATAIVTLLLAWLGLGLTKSAVARFAPKARGLLGK